MSPSRKPSESADPVNVGEQRLLRIEDVARVLNCSRSYAWAMTATGRLPVVRLGRAIRIRPQDLARLIDEAAGE